MTEKPNIPKFESESEEAEWWDEHREETAQWLERAAAAGEITPLSEILRRAKANVPVETGPDKAARPARRRRPRGK